LFIGYDLHSFGAGSCNDMGRYVLFDKPAKSSIKNSVEIVTVQFWYAKHLKNKNLIMVYILIVQLVANG
jgi:hypothetical protein